VSKCDGGTQDNPCNGETKYTLDWVMEDVHLCAKHYEEEDNAKTLREQIAQEIEAIMPADESNTDISFKIWNTVVEQCASIARGNND